MDKLKLAHDYALKQMESLSENSTMQSLVSVAWQYADAMQAEADKRNKAEAAQKRKEIREMLNSPNTFVEREGQHFDDVEEWQPDWSQAPLWAEYWAVDADGECYWFENKPELMSVTWLPFDASEVDKAPSFDYQGNWQDSLRKSPQ